MNKFNIRAFLFSIVFLLSSHNYAMEQPDSLEDLCRQVKSFLVKEMLKNFQPDSDDIEVISRASLWRA